MSNFNNRKTVGLYIRTAVQGEGVLLQEALLCGFLSSAKNSPYYLSRTRTFVDDGCSGMSKDRPGLKALMASVNNGELNAVLVVDRTRISRSTIGMIEIVSEIENASCEVWELTTRSRLSFSQEIPCAVGGAQ